MHGRDNFIRTNSIHLLQSSKLSQKKEACSLQLQVCPVHMSVRPNASQALSILQRVLISLKDALLHKLLWVGPAL